MSSPRETADAKYPNLMQYIDARNTLQTSAQWCDQLRQDEVAAESGQFSGVAREMQQAHADYGSYPYNSAMGEFLGLPLKGNNEPDHGYYMANQLMKHYKLGEAKRKLTVLIEQGKTLRIVTARAKDTRKPVRFATFSGSEIKITGQTVELNNGKRRARLSSNWSVDTCLQAVVIALETGAAYGEAA